MLNRPEIQIFFFDKSRFGLQSSYGGRCCWARKFDSL